MKSKLMALGVAWSLGAGVAHAQTYTPPYTAPGAVPQGVGAGDRARPEFSPIGGRIGSFMLYPTLTATGSVTDNVRASDTNRIGSAVLDLRGDVRLTSLWQRHKLEIAAFADQSLHDRLGTEDATEFGGRAVAQLDILRGLAFTVKGAAEHLVEDRRSYESVNTSRKPIQYGHYDISADITRSFDPISVGAGVRYAAFDYSDGEDFSGVRLSQRFRDYDLLLGNAFAKYRFNPGFSLLVRGTIDRRDYKLAANDPLQPGGFDRSSDGVKIEGGLSVELSSLLYGEIRAGYLKRDYADARFLDTSGFSYGTDILWNVTPLTSIRFNADRRVGEANSTLAAGNLVSEVGGTVDHELLRNLLLNAQVRYADIEPLGPVATSSDLFGKLGARYFISRRFSVGASYIHQRRTSPDALRRFRENSGFISVKATF